MPTSLSQWYLPQQIFTLIVKKLLFNLVTTSLLCCCFSLLCLARELSHDTLLLARFRYGEIAYLGLLDLNKVLRDNLNATEPVKLSVINQYVNAHITFTEDIDLWQMNDYWATPLESLGRGAGDCEDYSIAKYIFLKRLNINQDKLRLTYVRAILPNGMIRAHLILAYYETPSAEPLILDNLNPKLLPASERDDLYPIFSFNEKGLWLASKPLINTGSSGNISKWRDVLFRIQQDGLE